MEMQYRKNVGIVVFNQQAKVLMCARADKPNFQWQFPQGGINDGEDLISAAKRELQEETGIISVRPVSTISEPLRYDFPEAVKKRYKEQGSPFVGQEQSWVLFYFEGNDNEINFHTNPYEVEFKAYEWVDILDAPQRIVEFKKDVYSKVVNAFIKYIQPKTEAPHDCNIK